jgi:hypothetical protein
MNNVNKLITIPIVFFSIAGWAQTVSQPAASAAQYSEASLPDLSSQVPSPRPEDVQSKESLLAAIYDVISGPAGDRDWKRFRSLFLPEARFIRTAEQAEGTVDVRVLSVDDFIKASGDYFAKEGFYESAIANRVESFGHITQVFSSYESRHAPGEKPFARGINSIQLLNDGKRWWVATILWDSERPNNPLPPDFAEPAKAR